MSNRSRRGVALFAALAIIALIALLIGGAVASSSLAQRSAQLRQADALLATSADYAIGSVLADARVNGLADLALGRVATYVVATPAGGAVTATVAVTRLPRGVLWMVADAERSGRDLGRRRVNVVARWATLLSTPRTPLQARGAVRLRPGVVFSADTASDTECASTGIGEVVVPAAALVASVDSVRAVVDPAASDSAGYLVSSWQRQALDSAARAVHVHGDTTIAGGAFDGVMIVDGSLTIAGPFAVTGLIIARGPIVAMVGGFSLIGAIRSFAKPPAGEYALDLGGASIRFSPCAVSRAIRRSVGLHPVRERSWSELF